MANGNKMVDDQIIEMTDAEQKEYDDRNTAWTNEAPARRMTELRRQRIIVGLYMKLKNMVEKVVWFKVKMQTWCKKR